MFGDPLSPDRFFNKDDIYDVFFHRLLMSMTGFTDAFNEADKDAQEPCYTNDGPDNTYTASALLNKKYPGKRIDYILYNSGSNTSVVTKKYCRPLPNRVPGCTYSYSDHEAITATFKITRKEGSIQNLDLSTRAKVLTECIDNCNLALQKLINHKRLYWFFTATLFLIFISTIAMDTPFHQPVLIHVIRVIITILIFFTFIMATAWNMIEKHALLAGKLAMEVCLKQSPEKDI